MNRDDINKGQGGNGEVANGGESREQDNLIQDPNALANPSDGTADDAALTEWKGLMLEWLNNPPERTRPSVVLPKPPYFDRTITDRWRFMERAKPKITKDILKRIIRGDNDVFRDTGRPKTELAATLLVHEVMRNCLVAPGGELIYVPSNLSLSNSKFGDIEVPIGVDEPSWWPGRDKPGGGGGGQEAGEDDADIVYLPITYEEFLEMLALLFDLPFLKQTNEDKLLVYTIKMRGIKRSGPRVRMDLKATAIARITRFKTMVNARPEDYPGLSPDEVPTPEEFPYDKVDLRFKRVEERWDPDSKAVVFFELDTSGSMAGEPLAIAKFYFLLNLIWLRTRYKDVAVVYIAHNHRAERIRSERDFFRITDNGGTAFWPAHELAWQIAQAEFPGDDWNKYCLHATDGFGEHEMQIIPWIEKLIRGGFNYFGYCEINPYGSWWGNFETSGMRAVKGTAADVREHCGWARVSSLDEVPAAMMQIMTKAKSSD